MPRVVFVRDENQKTDQGARRGVDIDLTDEAAPSDFPVLEFLREQLVQLRSQNRELSDRIEKERHRVAPLERALAREGKRAAEADDQVKKLQRRIRNLEKKLAKLRSENQRHHGPSEQVGLLSGAVTNSSRTRSFTQSVDLPDGKKPEAKDRIRLTEEGERLAAAYRRESLRERT